MRNLRVLQQTMQWSCKLSIYTKFLVITILLYTESHIVTLSPYHESSGGFSIIESQYFFESTIIYR